jgi:hypothetical protein
MTMLHDNSAVDRHTPRDDMEQAEAAEHPPTTPAAQQKPDRAALLREAQSLLEAASPALRQALSDFLETELLRDHRGHIRRPRDIAARVLVACYLVSPSRYQSLAEIARAVDVTRTMVSRHAERFCSRFPFQMPPPPRNQTPVLRGAALTNHQSKLAREGSLEKQADALLTAAGVRLWRPRDPGVE